MATFYMETTRIDPKRTVGEIQELLGKNGANAILINYDAGDIVALSFKIRWNDVDVPFMLPCRWQAVEALLKKENKRPRYDDSYERWAKRVAWRQILRWVEAQLALVQTSMVSIHEVFLPYIQSKSGQTIFQQMEQNKFQLLEHKR